MQNLYICKWKKFTTYFKLRIIKFDYL
uniref:Uncharacterized protein n=1 Tax=Rhizophora mucronata TaxID=61149 RepID=A0A2P2PKL2_RHIMU